MTDDPKAGARVEGVPSLHDRVQPPEPDIRQVLRSLPHELPGGLIGNTIEQGPPYNLYEPRARIAAAICEANRHPTRPLEAAPLRVFEFGGLFGYGVIAVAHRLGVERTTIGWCDNERHTPDSNVTCRINASSVGLVTEMYCEHARESWSFNRADVVLIDADHTREATLDDLAYAFRLRPILIFVDDHIPEHPGVVDAVRTVQAPKVRIPTVNGLVAIQGPVPVMGQHQLEWLVSGCGLEWEPVA